MKSRYRILLAKQDFKFSSAHFTIFGVDCAEPLHGHNYRVAVELGGDHVDEQGLLFDLDVVKQAIRARCAELDSKTLVPDGNSLLEVESRDGTVELRYAERRYLLPANEVVVLSVKNVTIEELAEYFWRSLVRDLGLGIGRGERSGPLQAVAELAVTVEETDGQSCSYSAELN